MLGEVVQAAWIRAGSTLDCVPEKANVTCTQANGLVCDPRKAGKTRRGGYSFIGEKKFQRES